jgi:hypothetical protein
MSSNQSNNEYFTKQGLSIDIGISKLSSLLLDLCRRACNQNPRPWSYPILR